MKRKAATTIAAILIATGAMAGETKKETARPAVDVVFVLDTTGSMSGMIEAAKQKIWAIANTIAMSESAPSIRMGLVGYRDRGDAYVTKKYDLTDDIDQIYNMLMGFKADGGGDGPESVNQALSETINDLSWKEGDNVYRVVFLVGDSPPHMNYGDDVKYQDTVALALKKGIVVNTIQCGADMNTEKVWREIAGLAKGQFFQVDASGSAVIVSTPFDAKLETLSHELDRTRIFYGTPDQVAKMKSRAARAEEIYTAAPEAAKATRAQFNASPSGAKNFSGGGELIEDIAYGRVKLKDLDASLLPDYLAEMAPEARDEYISDLLLQRMEIQDAIETQGALRQAYIEKQLKETGKDSKKTLDYAIYQCVKQQAEPRGIVYVKGPVF